MAYLYTCRTCALSSVPCEARAKIQGALRGIGVRSAKHACATLSPAYQPGDPIKAQVRAYMSSSDQWSEESEAPLLWYRGRFIQFVGGKALVYVANGTEDEESAGYPMETGTGFMKVPLSRVQAADGERISVEQCVQCGSTPTLGQPCARDPNWSPPCRMEA